MVVFDIASTLQDPHSSAISDDELEDLTSAGKIGPGTSDLVMLVLPQTEEPVLATAGVLRVAARFNKNPRGRQNRNSDGRISVAKLIGYGPDSRTAHLALIELGESTCTPVRPRCGQCPLTKWCLSAKD